MPRVRPEMSEADVQRALVDGLRTLGWRVAHFHRARVSENAWATPVGADGKGFPDICCAKNGLVLFFEVKGPKGRLRPEQEAWKRELGSLVVRPDNLDETLAWVAKEA